jgi:hypothetical protein
MTTFLGLHLCCLTVIKQNLSMNRFLRMSQEYGSAGLMLESKMQRVEGTYFGKTLLISAKISTVFILNVCSFCDSVSEIQNLTLLISFRKSVIGYLLSSGLLH